MNLITKEVYYDCLRIAETVLRISISLTNKYKVHLHPTLHITFKYSGWDKSRCIVFHMGNDIIINK